MTYDQIFSSSYQRALGNDYYQADFIGSFYEHFFSKSTSIADMFANTNMSMQKTMLHDSLHILLDFYKDRELTDSLHKLAEIHGRSGLDVPDELYDLWTESLIETVARFDPEFDRDVELAWRLVLAPGITYIKFIE